MRAGRSRALAGRRTGGPFGSARASEAGEDRPELVEVDPLDLDGRSVGGIETPVDQPDEGLGGEPQLRTVLVTLFGRGGLERDRLAGLQGEVPLRVVRRHVDQ